MSTGAPPYCMACLRYRPRGVPAGGVAKPGFSAFTCDAFPSGIPRVILDSQADHRLPFEGDHGIRFAQNPMAEPVDWREFGLPRVPE